jgi:hypothetical protein
MRDIEEEPRLARCACCIARSLISATDMSSKGLEDPFSGLEGAEGDDEGKAAGGDGGKTVTLGISLPRRRRSGNGLYGVE